MINSFDIDGVIYLGEGVTGLFPGPNDVIITGRSYEEAPETYEMLRSRNIHNVVYFNNVPFDAKTRKSSGEHKANTIRMLTASGVPIAYHFEDDPVQIEEIRARVTTTQVIHVNSNGTVPLENVRHK